MINAILLASGYSKRLGRDKLNLLYSEKPLIEHILEKIAKCEFFYKIVVARDSQIIKLAEAKNFNTVKNNKAELGQSESVKLGIKNSPESDGYMFFTADQPLLDIYTIELLINRFKKNKQSIIVPKYGNRKGSPVIFPFRFKEELLEIEGDVGGKCVIDKHIEDVIFVEVKKEEVLTDIDTWEDYMQIFKKLNEKER